MEGSTLLGLRVVHLGIELGRVVGRVDGADGVVLAYEVRCGDGQVRLLPARAALVGDDEVVIASPLALLDDDQAAFYRRVAR